MSPPRRPSIRNRHASARGRKDGGAPDLPQLARVVRELHGLPWSKARQLVRSGKVFVDGQPASDEARPVRPGEQIELRLNAPRPGTARVASFARDAVVFLDSAVVVVNKPAGVSTVPFGDDEAEDGIPTLDAMVREMLAARGGRSGAHGRPPLGVVHRIDKETSGLLVFTRTLAAKKHLAQQFRVHSVHRRYLALVHGSLRESATYRSMLLANRGDGLRGSARPGWPGGQLAVTHVQPLEALCGATLVACRLETGRTHQIRIHLAEAGHPLVGERVYIRDYPAEPVVAPRLMLHAAELGFEHPTSGVPVRYAVEPPGDFARLCARLRG